jgi:DNA polymerase III epsilon subunit-like protein
MTTLSIFNQVVQETPKFLILDTETTGLHDDAEICQIAIINHLGETVLNTLVKPVCAIPSEAIAIHHITNERVENAPGWKDVRQEIKMITEKQTVFIYNRLYDLRLMTQSDKYYLLDDIIWYRHAKFYCVMEAFAELYGDWHSYYKTYRWKPLALAARYCGVQEINAHDALSDCLMTLGVLKFMSAVSPR